MSDKHNVYVVDSDAATRESLRELLSRAHFHVQTFASVSGFLADHTYKAGCLIINIRMPGINWLEFQIALARQSHNLIILVISDDGDIPMVIGAMREGVVDFIEKPLDSEQVITSVRRALDILASTHDRLAEMNASRAELAQLTPRERAVTELLLEGKSSKEVAAALKISPRTAEAHRAHIMKKLNVTRISQLVRLMLGTKEPISIANLPAPSAMHNHGLKLIEGGKSHHR